MLAPRPQLSAPPASARGDVVVMAPTESAVAVIGRAAEEEERLAPPDLRSSVVTLLRMVWRWRTRSAVIVMAFLLTGLLFVLLAPERFTSHATLIIGVRQPELMTAEQARDIGKAEPDIDGALELMRSQLAMAYVADSLAAAGIEQYKSPPPTPHPSLLARLRETTDRWLDRKRPARPPPDPMQQRYADLRSNFKLDRIGRSNLVDVAATSADPAAAAVAANALAAFSAQGRGALSGISLTEQSGFSIVRSFVVSTATAPEQPSSPNAPLILGIAIVLGLGTALTTSLFTEYRLKQTVLSSQELAQRGIRSLGLLPALSTTASRRVFEEAIASLQVALSGLPPRHGQDGLVLLVTSAFAGDGKSTVSAEIARSTAASGRKTLLIDADLRASDLSSRFGLAGAPGLSTCVRVAGRRADAVRPILAVPGLHVLAAGDETDDPFQVMASASLRDLIEQWRLEYQVIVVDAPPVLKYGETRLLAMLCDYTVLLARWGETSWDALSHALRTLAESGGRVAGVAISRADLRRLSRFDSVDSRIYDGTPTRPDPIEATMRAKSGPTAPIG